MPLTPAQFQENYVMNSLKDYLSTNIVSPYNAKVASTSYPAPLGIILERPPDPQVQPVLPLIVLKYSEDGNTVTSTGIGDGTVWYPENFNISFYPAMDTSNSPIPAAAALLRSYAKFALGTALYIPIYDYSQSQPYPIAEQMQVMGMRLTKPMGRLDPIFGIDRYRFDYQISCRYSVQAING